MSSDEWNFYFSAEDGFALSMFLDLALKRQAPVRGMGVCVRVTMHCLKPHDDGFSSDEEFDALSAVEDALISAACGDNAAIHAARITGRGVREFFFYAPRVDGVARALATVQRRFPQYSFDITSEADPQWKIYLERLYPDIVQKQQMDNRNVYRSLEENGDAMEAPREIDHWIYFPSRVSLDAFLAKVSPLGFALREEPGRVEEVPAGGREIYGARIFRVDTPSPGAFDDVTGELAEIAASVGGEYDGWETGVVRNV